MATKTKPVIVRITVPLAADLGGSFFIYDDCNPRDKDEGRYLHKNLEWSFKVIDKSGAPTGLYETREEAQETLDAYNRLYLY
jgi:hypothetical protein